MTREETLKGAPLKFTEMFHPIYSRELIGRIGNTQVSRWIRHTLLSPKKRWARSHQANMQISLS